MRKSRKSLEEKGWMFQFVADETLAKDAVEIYNLLDYEVHLQPLKRTHSRKASSPYLEESQGQCRIVYIRPKKSWEDEEE